MIDAVFISDLHLHPNEDLITDRFDRFIKWAANNTRTLYILGDFFHVWPGDDALDSWSETIASQLAGLVKQGIPVYFMHGNRDFLLGKRFAQLAGFTLLTEPTIITLGKDKILLMHGDRYCTDDKGHQWLRRLTRNWLFPRIFLLFPYKTRAKLVHTIRNRSQINRGKPAYQFDIVPSTMLKHMKQLNVETLIHGHTHKPGLTIHELEGIKYRQFVLSDWDDNPLLMCYDRPNGLYFEPFLESSNANRSK